MKYYNGTPVGDGILPEKKTPYSKVGSDDCAVFMTFDELVEKNRKHRKIKREYKPQDGDLCYVKGPNGYQAVFIFKPGLRKTSYYVSLAIYKGGNEHLNIARSSMLDADIEELRPATEEEKQRLFDAMAKTGKRWNSEKKVIEDILKPC